MNSWLVDISLLDICLLSVLGAAFLFQLYFYCRYILSVPIHEHMRQKHLSVQKDEDLPGVSILVCAHNEQVNISSYLHTLLGQDYPRFEVIVVNDSSEDRTQAVLDAYAQSDPRLHLTFIPKDARVGSNKKLGLTLAAKAAQYELLLLTDADCRPMSRQWIRSMVSGLQPDKDIVLGYGGYFVAHGPLNGMIRLDTLFNGLHYMGAAITSRPYMGVGRNLLYRKEFFFSSGGFTAQMNKRAGDDDLFINHVATHRNTAVVACKSSVTWSPMKKSFREWFMQKRRHLGVSTDYRTLSKLHLLSEPLSRGLFYAALILTAIICPLPWVGVAIALFAIRLIWQFVLLNTASRMLGQGHITVPMMVWDILLPLLTLYIMLTNKLYKTNRW